MNDVASIARSQAPSGEMIDRPYYLIRFDDGETWTTEEVVDKANGQRDAEIMALVSRKSGRKLLQLDLKSDLKP